MRQIIRSLHVTMFLLLASPLLVCATPAITCHCFTERAYNSLRPAAAAPYLLATTQNSFFAVVFSVEKKGIVMQKQMGSNSDDLWIAYWIARRGATASPESILKVKQDRETWHNAIAALGISDKVTGPRLAAALKNRAVPARLAESVVDELLVQYTLIDEKELVKLRTAGCTNQELILAVLLGARTGGAPFQIYRDVKNGSASWGAFLERAKINPPDIQNELSKLLPVFKAQK